MAWPPWPKRHEKALASYALANIAGRLRLAGVVRDDLLVRGKRKELLQAIYETLVKRDIRYAREPFDPTLEQQLIREPEVILQGSGDGTCLDLALLFAGLCLGNELLPLVVVLDGHAFVAVSLVRGRRDAGAPGRRDPDQDGPWVAEGLLSSGDTLRELVARGDYLPIECTGFSRSEGVMGTGPEGRGRVGGQMTFARAIEAGHEQLGPAGREFAFAIDVAILQDVIKIQPYVVDSRFAGSVALTVIYQAIDRAPASLSRNIRSREFRTLIDERTRSFVGRDFVFEAIDQAIADPEFPSGYIIIQGEPGIGKTALIGQLVKQRDYVHHFNIGPAGIRSAGDFLANVCAQLIVRYGLDHLVLPPKATEDSGFLMQLLAEAAEKAEGEPVVVLVDALDEAESTALPPDENRLLLPPALPPGVYFVVTTRELHDRRLSADQIWPPIYLRDDDPQNIEDVRQYVRNFVEQHRSRMAPRIAAWGVDDAEFIKILSEKSQGNFMYVVHVLRDIRGGSLDQGMLADIQQLPIGLRAYYERHWRAMREQDTERFEHLYKPVVCALAIVREPVPISRLAEWSERFTPTKRALSPSQVLDVIRRWRQFLNEDRSPEGDRAYRVYHASFQDFLKEEVDLTRYDNAIVDIALAKVPGFLSSP